MYCARWRAVQNSKFGVNFLYLIFNFTGFSRLFLNAFVVSLRWSVFQCRWRPSFCPPHRLFTFTVYFFFNSRGEFCNYFIISRVFAAVINTAIKTTDWIKCAWRLNGQVKWNVFIYNYSMKDALSWWIGCTASALCCLIVFVHADQHARCNCFVKTHRGELENYCSVWELKALGAVVFF